MFGKRGVPEVPATDPLLELSLASVSDRALCDELRRRGFAVICAGAWEGMCASYQAEIERLKAHRPTPAEWMAANDMVDATELVGELAEYASVHLPAAVACVADLGRENDGLRSQLDRVENEASVMAQVILGGLPNNDNEDPDD